MLSMVRSDAVVQLPFDPTRGDGGICPACGLRPAAEADEVDGITRCLACVAEARLGRRFPKTVAIEIEEHTRRPDDRPLGLNVRLVASEDDAGRRGWRFRGTEAVSPPVGERFGRAYVAVFQDDTALTRYREALNWSHFPSGNACARTREGTSSASMWTGTRVPRNAGFPPMILPINRSLVGARVERISSARALEMCLFLKNNQRKSNGRC
jgi:hypothetical protein